MGPVDGELPFAPEIAFDPLVGGSRNDREKQSALADLGPNPAIPGVSATKFILVEPYVDAGTAQ